MLQTELVKDDEAYSNASSYANEAASSQHKMFALVTRGLVPHTSAKLPA